MQQRRAERERETQEHAESERWRCEKRRERGEELGANGMQRVSAGYREWLFALWRAGRILFSNNFVDELNSTRA
jgi:hypothetical protein